MLKRRRAIRLLARCPVRPREACVVSRRAKRRGPHRPLVTCGDTGDDAPARAFLEPIFVANKVTLVLQAHMHGYERFEFDNGITYITAAGGGGLLGEIDENINQPYCDKRVAKAAAYHGVVFQVGTGSFSGKAIDESGAVLDTFSKNVP